MSPKTKLLSPESFGPMQEIPEHPQVHYTAILRDGKLLLEAANRSSQDQSLSLGQSLLLRAQKKQLLRSLTKASINRSVRRSGEVDDGDGDARTASLLRKQHRITFRLSDRNPDFVYAVVTDQSYGHSMPSVFLSDIEKLHHRTQERDGHTRLLRQALEERILEFSDITLQALESQEPNPKLMTAQANIAEVQNLVQSNLDELVTRNQDIDGLMEVSGSLSQSGRKFRQESQILRRHLWWKGFRLKVLNFGLVLLVLYIVAASFCGITFDHC